MDNGKISVTHVISDTNIGGAGRVLINLLKNYDRDKFEMRVIVPAGSRLSDIIRGMGISISELDMPGDRSFSIKATMEIFRELKRTKPDIVHTHAFLSARIAARMAGVRCVILTRHSVFDQAGYKKGWLYRTFIGSWNSRFCDRIIAVSPAAATNIIETGTKQDKISVVFNGVDAQKTITDEQKREVREKYGLGTNDFVCAIIARLEEEKGHKYILETASMVEKDVSVLIVGTGSLADSLMSDADKMGLKNVYFTGFVKDIYLIENIMDVQLNASFGTEATSLSLLEGMSLGVPAVVTDFGGNPFVISDGDNGIIVEKKSPKAMAEAIMSLKNDQRLYDEMSRKAKEIFDKRFTSRSMARQTEKVYIETMPSKGLQEAK